MHKFNRTEEIIDPRGTNFSAIGGKAIDQSMQQNSAWMKRSS